MNKRVKCEEPCDGKLSSMVPREGWVKFPPLTRQQNWNLGTDTAPSSPYLCKRRWYTKSAVRKILAADFVLRLFYRIVARTKVYKSKSDYQEWKEKGSGRLSVDKTISPEPVFTSVRDKKCCHVLRIFVSQTFHQNPICINTIAIVSSWENVCER